MYGGRSPAPWIALAIIATWALGLVALLLELGEEERRLSRRFE